MYHLLIRSIWIISLFSLCPAPQTDNNRARLPYGDVYIPPQVPLGRLAHETDVSNDHISESRQPGHETGRPSVVDRAEDNFRTLYPNTWTEHITLPENNPPPTSEHNDESSQVRSQRQSIVEKAEDNFCKRYPSEWKKPIELPQNDVQLGPYKNDVPSMPVTSPQWEHRDNPDDQNKNQTHLQSQPAPAPPPTPSPSPWELKFKRWKATAKEFAGYIFDVCASPKKNDTNRRRRRRRFHSSNSSNDLTAAIFAHEAATDAEPIHTTVAVALNDQAMNVPQVSVDTSSGFDIANCIGEGIKSIWDTISCLCCCLCNDTSCLNDLGSVDIQV